MSKEYTYGCYKGPVCIGALWGVGRSLGIGHWGCLRTTHIGFIRCQFV